MSDNKFFLDKVLKGLLEKGKDFLMKNKRKALILAIIVFLYFFVVLIYKVSSEAPPIVPEIDKYSYLYLMEYLNGWRDSQQDFDIEDLRFGEKFLTFTINIKYKAKSILIVKKLAIDMLIGLKDEYPELESISVRVIAKAGAALTVYGRADYSEATGNIAWKYQ